MGRDQTPKRGTEIVDDLGAYLLYDRNCKLCSTQLTSRNRHQLALLCKPCAASMERDRYNSKPTKRHRHSRPAWMIKQQQERRVDPGRAKAHSLLDTFLTLPTHEGPKQELDSYLMTYAIRAFMNPR